MGSTKSKVAPHARFTLHFKDHVIHCTTREQAIFACLACRSVEMTQELHAQCDVLSDTVLVDMAMITGNGEILKHFLPTMTNTMRCYLFKQALKCCSLDYVKLFYPYITFTDECVTHILTLVSDPQKDAIVEYLVNKSEALRDKFNLPKVPVDGSRFLLVGPKKP